MIKYIGIQRFLRSMKFRTIAWMSNDNKQPSNTNPSEETPNQHKNNK